MSSMSSIILILLGFSASAQSPCSPETQAVLLEQAQELEAGQAVMSQMYTNTDGGVIRFRRWYDYLGQGTSSFSEFFSRNGNGTRIFFIEKANGRYQRLDTNLTVTEVTFCDNDLQNVLVDWINGFPKIYINITCSADKSIRAAGHIQYFADRSEVVGHQWQKDGVPTLCDGAESIGVAPYFPVLN